MICALIVAAGLGLRMGGELRKQYLPLCGRPVVGHCLCAFDAAPQIDQLILVVPEEQLDYCRENLIPQSKICKPIRVVAGGQTRQESVFQGLQTLTGQEGWVLIHDGVRPLISQALIDACIESVKHWGACVPGIAVTETLKRVDPLGIVIGTIDRKGVWGIQTPQAFRITSILEAHNKARLEKWLATDDASLIEHYGEPVKLIPGSPENIKITTPNDLALAEFLFASAKARL